MTLQTKGLAGRWFRRRTPADDAGDLVVVVGATDVGNVDEGPVIELVVTSATFGAVPEGWNDATITYDVEAFAVDYTEASDAEREVKALEQQLTAQRATEANVDRESPWAYVARNERRTGKAAKR